MRMRLDAYTAAGEIRPLDQPVQRVMFFGKNMSRTRATFGLVEALRDHGVHVKWLNMATLRRWCGRRGSIRHARAVFRRYQPDLVFVFCRDLPVELLDEFRSEVAVALWVEESLQDISATSLDYFAKAHAVFLTNPSKIEGLREHGIEHAAFSMEGFSDSFHYALPTRRAKRDLVFIGGPGPEGRRARFLSEVARHFPLEIYGHGWKPWLRRFPDLRVHGPVKPPGYRRLCSESRIMLGLNQVNQDSLYFSNRTILTLACRGFHLTHYVPDLEQVFTDGEHLAWFRDLDHCLEQIDSYLRRPLDRAWIAKAGHDLVHCEHRFGSRIERILKRLAGDPPQTEDLPKPSFQADMKSLPVRPAASATE